MDQIQTALISFDLKLAQDLALPVAAALVVFSGLNLYLASIILADERDAQGVRLGIPWHIGGYLRNLSYAFDPAVYAAAARSRRPVMMALRLSHLLMGLIVLGGIVWLVSSGVLGPSDAAS